MIRPARLALPILAIGVLALVACGGGAPPSGATGVATDGPSHGSGTGPTPDPGGAAGLCAVLTGDEVAAVLGTAVGPGESAGPLDSGCRWDAEAGDNDLMIQKVPSEFFEDRVGLDGVTEIPDLGETAYVGPHAFGRTASARTADAAYIVVAAEPVSDDALVGALRLVVERAADIAIDLGGAIDPGLAGPSEPVTWAAGTDACPLTTEAVAEQMGRAMAQGLAECSWVAAADEPTSAYEVYLDPIALDLFTLSTDPPLAGIGDEAYGTGGTVFVRVGERAFRLQVLAMGADATFPGSDAVAAALARTAAEAWR